MLKVIEHHLDSIMLEAANQTEAIPQQPSFRCSALPFCPLLNFLADTRNESYGMDFYTKIGTAVHEVQQKWIPRTRYVGVVYGHWACKHCGTVIEGKNGKPIQKPEVCIHCESSSGDFTYEEVTVNYKGLSGHIDLITEVEPGKFVVWDFKTTDLGGKKRQHFGQWKDQYPSSQNYITQIRTYASLLFILWKFNVVAWSLIFVDRGKVIKSKNDYYKVIKPWNRKRREKHMVHIDKACSNNVNLQKLRREIEQAEGYSKRADKLLRHMVVHRPCTDEKSYDSFMSAAFWGNTECRFKKQCCKSSRASYNIILEALNPNDEPPW